MNECFSNILGIKNNCELDDFVVPSSGLFISDYPGINIKEAANIASGENATGSEYLYALRNRAMIRMQNDILRYINKEFKINSIDGMPWSTTKEVRTTVVAADGGNPKRGIVLEKKNPKCRLQKIYISKVSIAVPATCVGELTIVDVGTGSTFVYSNLDLQGGYANEFVINKSFHGNEVQLYLNGDIAVYSVNPQCNCGGVSSSPCVNVMGMINNTVTKTEAYGITAFVTCKCDFSNLLCDLSMDPILGQAAFELVGAMFYDERLKSTRFNWMTIYNQEEMKSQMEAAFALYGQYLADSLEGLKTYIERADNCGCIDCKGYKIYNNI